jgi:excisionase family DNA binding protein
VQIEPSDLLTVDEVASRLKVSRGWVFEKTRSRQSNPLPCMRPGRYLRFSWIEVSAWLKSTANTKAGRK